MPDNTDPRAGDRLRDGALGRLRKHRPALHHQLMRRFLLHLLTVPADTSDALRKLVEIPDGVDPRVVGSVVRLASEMEFITSVGRRKSRRPAAHSRQVDVWAIRDEARVRHWLATHPEPDEPTAPAGA